tara:strand:- start:166 stop:576 length:411 start_codon:yes stop_codon:yes gene_type:complete
MSDLMEEEKNKKIRNQWLEQIVRNERFFANKLKEENLPFDKFLELEKIQKKEQELKKQIENGHTPTKPPFAGGECVDGKFITLAEEITDMKDLDRIFTESQDLKDDEKSQPKQKIQEKGDGGNKFVGRICKLFSRK